MLIRPNIAIARQRYRDDMKRAREQSGEVRAMLARARDDARQAGINDAYIVWAEHDLGHVDEALEESLK